MARRLHGGETHRATRILCLLLSFKCCLASPRPTRDGRIIRFYQILTIDCSRMHSWEAARARLLNASDGHYDDNLNNLKIQAPCDDNYVS